MLIPYFHPNTTPPICIFIMQTIHTHGNNDKLKGWGGLATSSQSACEVGEGLGLRLVSHVQPWGCPFHSSILSIVLLPRLGGEDLEGGLKELM